MKPQQRVCRCRAQAGPASWSQHRVQRILIEGVHEAEMQSESAVWKFLLPNALDEEMNMLDILQALFYLSRVSGNCGSQNHRVEFRAFHAGRLQQPTVRLAEAVDLALNHAANRRGHVAANLLHGLRQNPTALFLNDDLPVPQVPHQVHHEEGISFCALPQKFCKRRSKAVLWELQCQISRYIRFAQILQA